MDRSDAMKQRAIVGARKELASLDVKHMIALLRP